MNCTICFEKIKISKILSCGHEYHSECINKWLDINKSCPLCRNIIIVIPTDPIMIKIPKYIFYLLNLSFITVIIIILIIVIKHI